MDKAHPTPIDDVARRVVYGKMVHDPFQHNDETAPFSEDPLPVIHVSPEQQDLRGNKYGSFTVFGLYSRKRRGDNRNGKARGYQSRWVVRCICGNYEVRNQRTLLRPKKLDDLKCRQCLYIDGLQRKHQKMVQGLEDKPKDNDNSPT